MKEPKVSPKPTFCGHKMEWVERAMPNYFGSFWMYRSKDRKVVVRAWPAQKTENDDWVMPPEVLMVIDHAHEEFVGRYKTHKELLRVLKRAESELMRQYKEAAKEYKMLLEVVK